MAGVAGIAFTQKLHDFHLTDIGRIVKAVMEEHESAGRSFADGAYERTMVALLISMRSYLGKKLEAEEVACPRRGIGMKEAA